jgi:hypothetical protein
MKCPSAVVNLSGQEFNQSRRLSAEPRLAKKQMEKYEAVGLSRPIIRAEVADMLERCVNNAMRFGIDRSPVFIERSVRFSAIPAIQAITRGCSRR